VANTPKESILTLLYHFAGNARSDGYAPNEAGIWKHEWLDSPDSDDSSGSNDESSGEDKTSGKLYRSPVQVLVWLSDLKAESRISNAC
jgi:hypothetical protein